MDWVVTFGCFESNITDKGCNALTDARIMSISEMTALGGA